MHYSKIMMETKKGEIVECFHWLGDPTDGIARATNEAGRFGFEPLRFWSEEDDSNYISVKAEA